MSLSTNKEVAPLQVNLGSPAALIDLHECPPENNWTQARGFNNNFYLNNQTTYTKIRSVQLVCEVYGNKD